MPLTCPCTLASDLINRSLFSCNGPLLSELDDAVNDDGESGLEAYRRRCFEIVARIAELFPAESLGAIYPQLVAAIDALMQTLRTAGGQLPDASAAILTNQCHDAAAMLQLWGRLAEHFVDGVFEARFDMAFAAFTHVCTLMELCIAYRDACRAESVGRVGAHTFGCLQAFSHWMHAFGVCAGQSGNSAALAQFESLVGRIVGGIILSLKQPLASPLAALAAARTMQSIVEVVRPPFLLQLPWFDEILALVSDAQGARPDSLDAMLYRALIMATLVLPGDALRTAQQWAVCTRRIAELLRPLVGPIVELCAHGGPGRGHLAAPPTAPSVRRSLAILTFVLMAVAHERNAYKRAVLDALKDTLPYLLELLSAVRSAAAVEAVSSDAVHLPVSPRRCSARTTRRCWAR